MTWLEPCLISHKALSSIPSIFVKKCDAMAVAVIPALRGGKRETLGLAGSHSRTLSSMTDASLTKSRRATTVRNIMVTAGFYTLLPHKDTYMHTYTQTHEHILF